MPVEVDDPDGFDHAQGQQQVVPEALLAGNGQNPSAGQLPAMRSMPT